MIEVIKKSNYINNLETECSKCKSVLRFNARDTKGGDDFTGRYNLRVIECPVCHKETIVYSFDYWTDTEKNYFRVVEEEENNERP